MVNLKNISHSFGGKKLFDDLCWFVKPRRRYGLVGPNGSGKTTLLGVMSGVLDPERGNVDIPKDLRVGYLPQEWNSFESRRSIVFEALLVLKDDNENEGTALEAQRYRAEKVLSGLGFKKNQMDDKVETLSGGWRMRVELAKIILKEPGLLLLDEPTNHLDISSIEWVERYLSSFEGTVVLVSHDKYLLERMVDTIAELEGGKIIEYRGNYSDYLKEKEKRERILEATFRNQQKKITQTERFIERFRYKNTKARQVQSRIKMLEKMEIVSLPQKRSASIRLRFPDAPRSGKIVYELSKFSKAYQSQDKGTHVVFNQAGPLKALRGDRIAICGRNGEGKTTLVKMIVGKEPFHGEGNMGYNVFLSYYAQNQSDILDYNATVMDEMISAAPSLPYSDIRYILGSFLFGDDDMEKKVSVLSGGEKSRLALSKLLVSPSNFLVLDEPTNHLDMESKEILLQALKEYSGTILFISHDRYFIDQLATRVWFVEGGKVYDYPGNYTEFSQKYGFLLDNEDLKSGKVDKKNSSKEKPSFPQKEDKAMKAEKRNKLYRKMKEKGIENMEDWRSLTLNQLKKAVEDLEKKIFALESRKEAIQLLLNDPEFFKDLEESRKKTRELDEITATLELLYHRWSEVTEYISNATH